MQRVQRNGKFTFVVSVTGPIAGREEQVRSVVNVILAKREAHVTGSLLVCIAAARCEALCALHSAAASSTTTAGLAALAEILPKHQIHRANEMRLFLSRLSIAVGVCVI